MLDIMRRKARSWWTLAALGVVIVVFIFFFGYTDLPSGRATGAVAQVNGIPISAGELRLAVENNTAFYRETFKEEIPEQIARSIRPSALQQLINQKLLLDLAVRVGLRVAPEALAERIRSQTYLQQSGQFDATYYKEQFLPQIGRRYGLNYEMLLENELLVDALQSLLEEAPPPSPVALQEAFNREKTNWTFEVVEVDPRVLVDAKKIGEATEAEDVAAELQAAFAQTQAREKLLKTYGLAAKRVGPIPLASRFQLLGADATLEAYRAAFALTPAQPTPGEPLHIGNRWVVLRLVQWDRPAAEAWQKEEGAFTEQIRKEGGSVRLRRWIETLAADARIRRTVALDES